jgi:hypothetical protein
MCGLRYTGGIATSCDTLGSKRKSLKTYILESVFFCMANWHVPCKSKRRDL